MPQSVNSVTSEGSSSITTRLKVRTRTSSPTIGSEDLSSNASVPSPATVTLRRSVRSSVLARRSAEPEIRTVSSPLRRSRRLSIQSDDGVLNNRSEESKKNSSKTNGTEKSELNTSNLIEKTKRRSIRNNDIETRNVQSPVLRITRLSQSLSPENVKTVEISTRRTRAWAAASALSGIREELKEDSPKNMKSVSKSAEKSAEKCKNECPSDENLSEKYHVNTNSKTITAENKSITTNESIVTPKKSPNTRKSAEYDLKMESEVNVNSIEKKKPLKKRLSLSSDCTYLKQSPQKIENQAPISGSDTKSIEEHVVNDSNKINVSISKNKASPVVVISKELINDVCLKQNNSECKVSDNDITVSNTCDGKMSENVVIVLNNCNKSMNKISDKDISTVKLNIVCDEDKILNTDATLETVAKMREIIKDESIELNDSSDVHENDITDVSKIIIPNESKEKMISHCVDNKCNKTELTSNKISSKLTGEDIDYLNSSESKVSKVISEKDSKESESDTFSLRVDESSMSEKSDTVMKSDTTTKKTELISPCKKKYSPKNSYESSTYNMDKNEESKSSLDNADINLFYERDNDNCISQVSNESFDKNSEMEDSNKFVLELDNEKDSEENSEAAHLTVKTNSCIIATNDSNQIKIIENKNSQKENENIMNSSLKDSLNKSPEKSEIIKNDESMFIKFANVNKGEVDKNILNLSSNKNDDENNENCNKDELVVEKGETNFVNKIVTLNESSGEIKGISENIDIIDSLKIGTDEICKKSSATNPHSLNKIEIIDIKTRNVDEKIKFQQKEKKTKMRLSRKISSEDSNDEEISHKKRNFIKKQDVCESLSKFESSDSEQSLKSGDLKESIHNSSDSNEKVDHSGSKNLSENTKSDETNTSSNEENRTDFSSDEDEKNTIEHKEKSDQKSVKKTINLCNESSDESNSGSSDYFDNEAMECDGTDTPSDGSNDIPVKGESLGGSDTDENTTDSYEEGSFIVGNLSVENDLLSGTGDDLSNENFSVDSDDLLTQSKKDKAQFNIKKRKRSRIIVQSSSEDEKDKEIKSLYENLLRKLNDSSESKEKQAENEDDLKLKTISERKEKNKEAESEVNSEICNKNTSTSEEDSETLEKVESKMKKDKSNNTSESENEDIFHKKKELKKFVGTDELNSGDDGTFCEDLISKINLGKKTRSQELLFSEESDDKKHEIVKDSDSGTEKDIKPNTKFNKLKKSEVMPFNQEVIEISTDYTSSDNQKMLTEQKENKDNGKVSLNAKKISKGSSSTILQFEDSDKNESDWGSLTVMVNVSPQVNSTITETISVSDNSCSSLSGEEIKKKVTNPSTKNFSKKIDNQADLNDDSEMETIIINEGGDALGEDYSTENRIQNKKNENLSNSLKSDSSFKESQQLKNLTTERKSLNIIIDDSEINKSIKSMSDNEGIEENTSKSISSVEECDFTDLSSTSISKSKKYIRKRNRKSKSSRKSRNEEIDLEKSIEVSDGIESVKSTKDTSIISTENNSIYENLVLEINNEDVEISNEISSHTSESKKHKRRNKRESLSKKKK